MRHLACGDSLLNNPSKVSLRWHLCFPREVEDAYMEFHASDSYRALYVAFVFTLAKFAYGQVVWKVVAIERRQSWWTWDAAFTEQYGNTWEHYVANRLLFGALVLGFAIAACEAYYAFVIKTKNVYRNRRLAVIYALLGTFISCNMAWRGGVDGASMIHVLGALTVPMLHSIVLCLPFWMTLAQSSVMLAVGCISYQSLLPSEIAGTVIFIFANIIGYLWYLDYGRRRSFLLHLRYISQMRHQGGGESSDSTSILVDSTAPRTALPCRTPKAAMGTGSGSGSGILPLGAREQFGDVLQLGAWHSHRDEVKGSGDEVKGSGDEVKCGGAWQLSPRDLEVPGEVSSSGRSSDETMPIEEAIPPRKRRRGESRPPQDLNTHVVVPVNKKKCTYAGCTRGRRGISGLCIAHGGGLKCSADACTGTAKKGGLCKAHGGGKRCQQPGCPKSAQDRGMCIAHGGGKKCSIGGCSKLAKSGGLCIAHGGGKTCSFEGCMNVAQSRGVCKGHGGGKRCERPNCNKFARVRGLCILHASDDGPDSSHEGGRIQHTRVVHAAGPDPVLFEPSLSSAEHGGRLEAALVEEIRSGSELGRELMDCIQMGKLLGWLDTKSTAVENWTDRGLVHVESRDVADIDVLVERENVHIARSNSQSQQLDTEGPWHQVELKLEKCAAPRLTPKSQVTNRGAFGVSTETILAWEVDFEQLLVNHSACCDTAIAHLPAATCKQGLEQGS